MVTAYETREEADAALTEGWMVCATLLKDGAPRYFLLPKDAPDEVGERTAFLIRNGRPLSDYEQFLLDQVRGAA